MLQHVEAEELRLADRRDRGGEGEEEQSDPEPRRAATRQRAIGCSPAAQRPRAHRVRDRREQRPARAAADRTSSRVSTSVHSRITRPVQLFHYHLVTSRVRQVEARYVGKLAFELVARHGRIGEEYQSFEAGFSWEELDRMGFKLRLSELERGAVNVVVQPGQWELPARRPPRARARRGGVRRRDRPGGRAGAADPGARRTAHVHRHERRLPARGAPAARVARRAARARPTT